MSAGLLLIGTGTYLLAGVAYFRARFRLATLLGIVFWLALGWLLVREAAAPFAVVALALFAALPAALLVVHAVDARRGIFLLPTIYSIPLAFLAGVALWCAGVAAWLF